MLNLLNWEWVTVAHSTHTLLFYWFIRFLWSLKSLNVTKSKRRHDWQMPSHFNLSQRKSTARILCGKLVHILISALFCYFISFHFIFVSRKFLRTEKWIWWSYLMALCSAKCCLNSSHRVVRFDYDLEKWVFISFPTFNISVMYRMRELNPH